MEKEETSKEKPIKAVVLDNESMDVQDIKLDTESISYGEKTLNVDIKKVFTETNWSLRLFYHFIPFFSRVKQQYLFFDLTKGDSQTATKDGGQTIEPVGLEKFDPTRMISAEEADLMIHETATLGAVKNIVQAIGGKGFSPKLLMFIIIIVVIIAVVAMQTMGMLY